jgi:hypothetical protein
MKIGEFEIYLKAVEDHKCPLCGDGLDRRPRRLWQKAVSFAVPLRHYKCGACYQRFFALSPSWKQMNKGERWLRVAATGVVWIAGIFIVFRIIYGVLYAVVS